MSYCPNCNEEHKEGAFSANRAFPKLKVAYINQRLGANKPGYCDRCGKGLFREMLSAYNGEREAQNKIVERAIKHMPVLTLHNPHGWDYTPLALVTGQSTTGTGAFSEISASFSDILGGQSGAINSKLKKGEAICMTQLRWNALNCGGNAVIGCDIDYAEMGGDKGMIMVCMSGTAVMLWNPELKLSAEVSSNLGDLAKARERLSQLDFE